MRSLHYILVSRDIEHRSRWIAEHKSGGYITMIDRIAHLELRHLKRQRWSPVVMAASAILEITDIGSFSWHAVQSQAVDPANISQFRLSRKQNIVRSVLCIWHTNFEPFANLALSLSNTHAPPAHVFPSSIRSKAPTPHDLITLAV